MKVIFIMNRHPCLVSITTHGRQTRYVIVTTDKRCKGCRFETSGFLISARCAVWYYRGVRVGSGSHFLLHDCRCKSYGWPVCVVSTRYGIKPQLVCGAGTGYCSGVYGFAYLTGLISKAASIIPTTAAQKADMPMLLRRETRRVSGRLLTSFKMSCSPVSSHSTPCDCF